MTPEEDIFASPTSATAARSLTASFGSSVARAPTTSVASTDVPENVVADVVHEPMDKQDTRILVCQENIDKQEEVIHDLEVMLTDRQDSTGKDLTAAKALMFKTSF